MLANISKVGVWLLFVFSVFHLSLAFLMSNGFLNTYESAQVLQAFDAADYSKFSRLGTVSLIATACLAAVARFYDARSKLTETSPVEKETLIHSNVAAAETEANERPPVI